MPRPLRIEFPNALYHVTARGVADWQLRFAGHRYTSAAVYRQARIHLISLNPETVAETWLRLAKQ